MRMQQDQGEKQTDKQYQTLKNEMLGRKKEF